MFRNPLTQENGLEKVYKGEFEQDPSADFLLDVVDKCNHNVDILDEGLGAVAVLQAQLAKISAKGLLDGYLNGGVCGIVSQTKEECELTISRMYVTPIDFSGDPPTIAPPTAVTSEECPEPFMVLYTGLEETE
jgi:hypothetical protein